MPKKILIIEDEANLQKALSATFSKKGYGVLLAPDGNAGIRMAQEEKPDLIMLDLVLPQKDGFAVLSELKEDPAMSRTPIVVLTNLEGSHDVNRALELGATTFLVKTNYQLEEIAEKIKEILGSE